MNIFNDALLVGLVHAHLLMAAAAAELPSFVLHHLAQALNLIAVNSTTGHHHFEAVVVLGVVTAGDLNTAGAQGVGCEIQLRRGDHAHIDDLYPRVDQALHQGLHQLGPAQSAITPNGHFGFPLRQRLGAKGST